MDRLSDLKIDEKATVIKLDVTGPMRRRFQDIGLIEGTKVECVLQSPLGDPKAYEIRGAVIAIREEDARRIIIKK